MKRTTGTYIWFGYLCDFNERLKAIKQAGFDSICTFWTAENELTDGKRVLQPELADKAGLKLEHAHLKYYGCDGLWADNIDAEALVEGYISDIALAKTAGVKTLVIHPCEVYAPDIARYKLFFNNMRRISDEAERFGIRLAIENLGEKEAVKRIISDLSENPFVGLCFDSGHNNIVNGDDFYLLRDFSDRIFALHLHDNGGSSDRHLLPFSNGCNINWPHFTEALNASSFKGSLMLEACFPTDYEKTDFSAVWQNPPLPMSEWLKAARASLDRINT